MESGNDMKLSRTTKNIMFMICAAALVIIVGGAVFYRSIEALYFAFGVVLTSALNVLKIYMLERTVNRTLDMDDKETGSNFVRLQYLVRYFLTGAVLLGVGLIWLYVEPPFINIWGAVLGVFTLQIAVIIVRHRKLED
jgi:hypothetical protein